MKSLAPKKPLCRGLRAWSSRLMAGRLKRKSQRFEAAGASNAVVSKNQSHHLKN
jgi:hypothetical protein